MKIPFVHSLNFFISFNCLSREKSKLHFTTSRNDLYRNVDCSQRSQRKQRQNVINQHLRELKEAKFMEAIMKTGSNMSIQVINFKRKHSQSYSSQLKAIDQQQPNKGCFKQLRKLKESLLNEKVQKNMEVLRNNSNIANKNNEEKKKEQIIEAQKNRELKPIRREKIKLDLQQNSLEIKRKNKAMMIR